MTWRKGEGLLAHAGRQPALLLTTNPGLEDLAADELAERLARIGIAGADIVVELRPLKLRGNLVAVLPRLDAEVRRAVERLRAIHHLVQPLYAFELPVDAGATGEEQLAALAGVLAARGVAPLATAAVATFRVTTRRSGTHPFTSIDVQRRAGAVLAQRYGLGVDLEAADLEVRVDVLDRQCLVGVQLTGDPLSRRKAGPYRPRASLKPNVAYALLRCARLGSGSGAARRILDPFCGAGTIAIEAARLLPGLRIDASDFATAAVDGSAANLAAAGLTGRVVLTRRDLDRLDRCYPAATFDAIVTNPPFGVRLGRGMNFHTFYQRFLEVAAHLLKPGGLLVFLAWKRGVVDKANRRHRNFRRRHVRVVETGGIYPRLYVFERHSS